MLKRCSCNGQRGHKLRNRDVCEKVLLLHKLSLDIAADSLPGKEEAEDDQGVEEEIHPNLITVMLWLLHRRNISLFFNPSYFNQSPQSIPHSELHQHQFI